METAAAPRTCACRPDCPAIVKSVSGLYARGHQNRRADRGRRQLDLCACGCGELVKTPGSRFRAGHNTRTAEWHDERASSRQGEEQPCSRAGCTNTVYATPSRLASARAIHCADWCEALALRRNAALSPVQERLVEQLERDRLTLRQFLTQHELAEDYEAVRQWLRGRVRTMSKARLGAIANALGLDFEDVLEDVGGKTAEQQRSELGRVALTADARAKRKIVSGTYAKGWPRSPEHRDAIARAHARLNTDPTRRARQQRLIALARLWWRLRDADPIAKGAIRAQLDAELKHLFNPTQRGRPPTSALAYAELALAAAELADEVGLSTGEIANLAGWKVGRDQRGYKAGSRWVRDLLKIGRALRGLPASRG